MSAADKKELATATSNIPGAQKKRNNQYSNDWAFMPYSLKYAICKVLIEQGHKEAEIRALTGLSHVTIWKVRHGKIVPMENVCQSLRQNESSKLTMHIHRVMDSMGEKDLEKASLSQKVLAAGVMIDKRQIIEGKATTIVKFAEEDEALLKKIQEKEDEIRAWEDGRIVNTTAEHSVEEPLEVENEGNDVESQQVR